MAVDRDARTAWVPAAHDADMAHIEIALPGKRRVAAIELDGGIDRRDENGDWSALFERPIAYQIMVDTQHHVAYAARWMAPHSDLARLNIVPTMTDTVSIDIVMSTWPELERTPALREVRVFACADR